MTNLSREEAMLLIASKKQTPWIKVLTEDREYLILEGLIKGLEKGQFYDKTELAKVLRTYQEWVFKTLKTSLDIAERAEFNSYVQEQKFEEIKQWAKLAKQHTK